MKKMNKKFITIIFLILLIIIGFGGWSIYQQNQPGETIYISVNEGESVNEVIANLKQAGVKTDGKRIYKEFVKENASVYPNNYQLTTKMSPKEIVTILNNPQSNIRGDKLVVIEGDNLKNVAKNVETYSKGRITQQQILAYWSNQENLQRWIDQYWFLTDAILNPDILYPLEGFFAPATYNFSPDCSLEEVTTKMLDTMNTNLTPYQDQSTRQGLCIEEFITLASVVERETMHSVDQAKVAGVFYNRLKTNMPLQSDITVLYAKQEHKEHVMYDDLAVNSPYNTYLHEGLPIGPIAMVSASVLQAVSQPEQNDYYYFFAKQDTGEIIYSKTLEEHEKVSEDNAWK